VISLSFYRIFLFLQGREFRHVRGIAGPGVRGTLPMCEFGIDAIQLKEAAEDDVKRFD
jgi:hypothetical protein